MLRKRMNADRYCAFTHPFPPNSPMRSRLERSIPQHSCKMAAKESFSIDGCVQKVLGKLKKFGINKLSVCQSKALRFFLSATRSIGPIQELLQKSNKDLGLSKRKTHHANKTRQDVFNRVLHQVHQKAAVFKYSPGRKYNSFPNVQPIFTTIDRKQLHAWIKRNKSKWHRQNRHLYSK